MPNSLLANQRPLVRRRIRWMSSLDASELNLSDRWRSENTAQQYDRIALNLVGEETVISSLKPCLAPNSPLTAAAPFEDIFLGEFQSSSAYYLLTSDATSKNCEGLTNQRDCEYRDFRAPRTTLHGFESRSGVTACSSALENPQHVVLSERRRGHASCRRWDMNGRKYCAQQQQRTTRQIELG